MTQLPAEFAFSFSSLEAYRQCPLMFRLSYIDRVPRDDNAFSQYGTFCHHLLEQYAKGDLPDFALAEAYERGYDNAVTMPWPPFPKGMPGKYYAQGIGYFENFKGFGEAYDILAVEDKFRLKIDQYQLVGIADLVLMDKNTGEITVVDHKSKSVSSMEKNLHHSRRQLYIYAAYVKEKWGRFPKYLNFNLFRENKWVTEEFNQSAFDETMQWILDTIQSILKEEEWPSCCSSYFCRFVCSVAMDCPAWQKEMSHAGA